MDRGIRVFKPRKHPSQCHRPARPHLAPPRPRPEPGRPVEMARVAWTGRLAGAGGGAQAGQGCTGAWGQAQAVQPTSRSSTCE